ncbi:MAG TPA: FAD-dependent oxidoreductase [Polyangiaceae bacterium]|nr:FAD-dependent oxidoreductase [Polyangiaceae bacterium]
MRAPSRRSAKRAAPSWDVTRQRGWLPAASIGAVTLLVVLGWRQGIASLAAPGPLAGSHAALPCARCHEEGARREPRGSAPLAASMEAACTRCHSAHPSQRAPHRALAERGVLACPTCHTQHRDAMAIAFDTTGRVSVLGNGFSRELDRAPVTVAPPNSPHAEPSVVPLLSARACGSCHERATATDPAAHCFTRGASYSLCFDEHRRVGRASGAAPAQRDAAIERTRELARALPPDVFDAAALGPEALSVALGLGAAGLTLGLDRRRRRRRAPGVSPLAPSTSRRLPVIDGSTCLGCHACVDACPFDALAVRRYVAVLERPDECCGAGPCQSACPNGSLVLVPSGAEPRGPKLTRELESSAMPGIFVAGDATGGALVRSALRQGVAAARAIAERIERLPRGARQSLPADLVIVGAGPAGLAAALTARAGGLRVSVLEQARLAQSIRRFSRGKLVLDTPSPEAEELPLFIGDIGKEELVTRWQRTLRSAKLDVREGARVHAIERRRGGGFTVCAALADEETLEVSAHAVLVATGTRGTPRELAAPIAEGARERVHYELSDARAFAGLRVFVVGLGDVAMESALALAAQPGSEVTIVHRGTGFLRGKRRNIEALSTLAVRGRVRLLFDAEIETVDAASLDLVSRGVRSTFPFDALFVHVGCVPGNELLARVGVCSPQPERVLRDPWDSERHDRPSS